MNLIFNSIEPTTLDLVLYFNTSKEVWDAINKQFGKRKINHFHIYHLKRGIQQLKQNQRPVIEYISDLKRWWEELNLYLVPTTDQNNLKEREHDSVYQFLAGLDDSYEPIRAWILRRAELPSLDDAMSLVQGEETRRMVTVRCENCKKEGHERDRCWFLYPHLKPRRWKNNGDRREREKIGNVAAPGNDSGETIRSEMVGSGRFGELTRSNHVESNWNHSSQAGASDWAQISRLMAQLAALHGNIKVKL